MLRVPAEVRVSPRVLIGVFFRVCPVFINLSLWQRWRWGCRSKVEWLLCRLLACSYVQWVLAHHSALLSSAWALGSWELTGKWVLGAFRRVCLTMLLSIEVWSNIPVFLYWCICLCVHVCEYVYVHMSSRKIFWRATRTSREWVSFRKGSQVLDTLRCDMKKSSMCTAEFVVVLSLKHTFSF